MKEERIIAAKQKARDIATHNVLAAAAASALDAQKAADIEAGIAGKVSFKLEFPTVTLCVQVDTF